MAQKRSTERVSFPLLLPHHFAPLIIHLVSEPEAGTSVQR